MTVADARTRLAEVVDGARVNRELVFLTRRGKRIAALIGADDLSCSRHNPALFPAELVA